MNGDVAYYLRYVQFHTMRYAKIISKKYTFLYKLRKKNSILDGNCNIRNVKLCANVFFYN